MGDGQSSPALMADAAAGRVRHGGFVDTAATDQFDAACYGISRAEAMGMDPQQRLLLEHGHTSLLASLIGRSEGGELGMGDVEGRLTGVFVGIMAFEFGFLLSSAPAGGTLPPVGRPRSHRGAYRTTWGCKAVHFV